jgi:DivIVA domain-containing protein
VTRSDAAEAVEGIRNATFTLARRGYDTGEVDAYLSKLADWLERSGSGQAQSETIKRQLEQIGHRTAKILTAAEEAAQGVRVDLEAEARRRTDEARIEAESARRSADQYAKRTRDEADAYAATVRAEAEAQAAEKVKEAEARAIGMVEEGAKRRREMESVIADLQSRREAVVRGLEKLSTQLAGTATEARAQGPRKAPQPAPSAQPPAPSRQ